MTRTQTTNRQEVNEVGMTDAQWKSYLRAMIDDLEDALALNPDNAVLKKMIARLKLDLEG